MQKVDKTYNEHYLRAEYNFVTASAQMAARWEQIEAEADSRVREEHAALHGITLPPSDPFGDTHLSPNSWNCRCQAIQVRKTKYHATAPEEVRRRVAENEKNERNPKAAMFRVNSGKQRKAVPDYNAYTISKCTTCPRAQGKGKLSLAKIEANELCSACNEVRMLAEHAGCYPDPQYGERLLTHRKADHTELKENKGAARVLLKNFPDMRIEIREHSTEKNVKNPEYLINGQIADRKGIEGANGVTSAFKKAIMQGCTAVVIDTNVHLSKGKLQTHKLAQELGNRFLDFHDGTITECYVIYRDKAVLLTIDDMPTDPSLKKGEDKGRRRAHIEAQLQKIAAS